MIKKLFSKLGVVFFLVAFLFSTCNVNVITYADDTGMRDISGLDFVKDMKVGWNLGNTFDAGDETTWGNPVTTHAMIDELKKEGFNTLRLPVSWYKHIGAAPDYTIDSAYINRVEEVAKYAFDNNMYVILNIHHDNTWIVPTYAHEDQTVDELTKVWTQIANHFKNYNDHLIFETMNEPRPIGAANEWSGGSAENRDVINKFNAAAVTAIRNTGGNNEKRFIMIPTIAASDQSVALNDFVIPNDSRIIVSLHMYTPYLFAMGVNSTTTWGSDSDKGSMDSELNTVYNKFIKNGQAVVIGEFGSINKSNEASRVAHAKYFAQAATSRGMTPIWWDNGLPTANVEETYAIFNRNALNWYFPDIAEAFIDGAAAGYASGTIIGGTGEVVNGVIDDFESYNGDNSVLRSKYVPVAAGGAVTTALDTTNKNGGSNGLKFDYDVAAKGYCGVIKSITADAKAYTGLSFWVKPDNTDRDVTVQFRESSGEYWEATTKISGGTASTIYIPFSSFKVPSWYTSGGNGVFDLDSLDQFNIYIGQGSGSAATGTLYFDDFKLVNPNAIKYGDVNGDGRINVLDYLLVKKYINGVITKFPSDNGLKAADVNGDSKIDNNDYVLIRSYLIHKITKFTVAN